MSDERVVADLDVDIRNEDGTGYFWQWLDAARDPAIVTPGAIVVVTDGDASAMAHVVDLTEVENDTTVHLRLLPGRVAEYRAALERAATWRA